MKKDTRLYNMYFPVWLLLIIPSAWLYVLPINFLIDSAVVIITLCVLAKRRGESEFRPWKPWLRSILPVWLFGFLSDIIGAGFMLFWGYVPEVIGGESSFAYWWGDNIVGPISTNPFSNFAAFLFAAAGVALAAGAIYFFNSRFSFKKLGLAPSEIKTLSLTLAIATAPYVFLIPSQIFYR